MIAPAASPSAASGVRLKVANTEGQGANMRQRPSTTAPVLRTLPDGTVVEAIGGETNAEGRNWRNVRDPNGQTRLGRLGVPRPRVASFECELGVEYDANL